MRRMVIDDPQHAIALRYPGTGSSHLVEQLLRRHLVRNVHLHRLAAAGECDRAGVVREERRHDRRLGQHPHTLPESVEVNLHPLRLLSRRHILLLKIILGRLLYLLYGLLLVLLLGVFLLIGTFLLRTVTWGACDLFTCVLVALVEHLALLVRLSQINVEQPLAAFFGTFSAECQDLAVRTPRRHAVPLEIARDVVWLARARRRHDPDVVVAVDVAV